MPRRDKTMAAVVTDAESTGTAAQLMVVSALHMPWTLLLYRLSAPVRLQFRVTSFDMAVVVWQATNSFAVNRLARIRKLVGYDSVISIFTPADVKFRSVIDRAGASSSTASSTFSTFYVKIDLQVCTSACCAVCDCCRVTGSASFAISAH